MPDTGDAGHDVERLLCNTVTALRLGAIYCRLLISGATLDDAFVTNIVRSVIAP